MLVFKIKIEIGSKIFFWEEELNNSKRNSKLKLKVLHKNEKPPNIGNYLLECSYECWSIFFNFKTTFNIGFDIIIIIIFARFFGCEIELHISKPYNLDFITHFEIQEHLSLVQELANMGSY
jgi:hypothetical protein